MQVGETEETGWWGGTDETWILVGKTLPQVGQGNWSLRGVLGVWAEIGLVSSDGVNCKEWLVGLVPDDGVERKEWFVGLNCGVVCRNGLGVGWVGGGDPGQESNAVV